MISINAADVSPVQLYGYLNHAIAPRPICFVSTISKSGRVNLSPFSFFNLMSTDPPVCVFSPVSNRNNEPKHTLLNAEEVPEAVINIVNYPMVQQMNLTSGEYGRDVDEFVKSGFTPLTSALVRPPRVAEAPVQLECIITQIIKLGDKPNAGNLILAEVKLMHLQEGLIGADGKIDQAKLNLVARLGADWYCWVTQDNLFKVARPVMSIGVESLPQHICSSNVLTGNDLGMLANTDQVPGDDAIQQYQQQEEVTQLLNRHNQTETHTYIKQLLGEGRVDEARLLAWSS